MVWEMGALLMLDLNKKTKKKPKKKSHGELQLMLDKFGVKSNEFYVYVKEFIIYVLNRYVKDYDEDLIIDCYVKIVESIEGATSCKKEWQPGYIDKDTKEVIHGDYITTVKEIPAYFDPARTNIGNFIYTVIRNRATLHLYYRKKYFSELDENDELLRNQVTKNNKSINSNLNMWFYYNALNRLKISDNLKQYILDDVISKDMCDNIFYRVAKWETVRLALN